MKLADLEMYRNAFLTSALDDEWSASRFGHFTLWKRVFDVRWTQFGQEWVGPTGGLDIVANRRSPVTVGYRTPVVKTVRSLSSTE
jgi:hypothetical protein